MSDSDWLNFLSCKFGSQPDVQQQAADERRSLISIIYYLPSIKQQTKLVTRYLVLSAK